MSKIDCLATERHFLDHLLPVYKALPAPSRGKIYIHKSLEDRAKELSIPVKLLNERSGTKPNLTLVASYGDLKKARANGSRCVLMEHGAGQSYKSVKSGSYVGAPDRSGVVAVLVPGERHVKQHEAAHPTIPAYPIGIPKLDYIHGDLEKANNKIDKEIVVISFHWDCNLAPETKSAFRYYRRVLKEVSKNYKVFGHGHPKDYDKYKAFWDRIGVESIKDFDEVIDKGWVYCCDNSSSMFEWISLDRPVVVMNAPCYRRNIEHGMRFWEYADMGVQVDRPDNLIKAIKEAQADASQRARRRKEIKDEVYYKTDGKGAERAAERLVEIREQW